MADFPTPIWPDLGYWQKRKKGRWRLMQAPAVTAYSDTHCHLNSLECPDYALARAALLGVQQLCTIVDPTEDDKTFLLLDRWVGAARRIAILLWHLDHAFPLPKVGESVDGVEWLERWCHFAGTDLGLDWFHLHAATTKASSDLPVSDTTCSTLWDAVAALVSSDPIEEGDLVLPDDFEMPRMPVVHIGVGCHPHNASKYDGLLELKLRDLCSDSRVCCIGEIGLDYHYDLSPRDVQREVFRRQVRLAHELEMPIALHVREAHDEALDILMQEGFPQAGVLLHCCSLGPDEIRPWIEAGCWIAYGGPLTFNNAEYARQGARLVPVDRLLTETDSPYMTPVPLRGVACMPDFAGYNAAALSEIMSEAHGMCLQEAARQLLRNACDFLNKGPFPCQRQ